MSVCYLDANATTFMPEIVIKALVKWANKGNASAHYCKSFRELAFKFKESILLDNNLKDFTVVFTSGASESNAFIITSAVRSYMNKTGHLPHVIISEIEHKSIQLCCQYLEEDALCQCTKIKVKIDKDNYGMVDPVELQKAIRPNTCLISIMAANNETGIINDIPLLASIAHKNRIPFHSDIVQYFGKYGIYEGLDACSISFHKLSGPPGVGCAIIRNSFLEGYNLKALIPGTQNNGLRGGTDNISGIAASYAAYKYNLINRDYKNKRNQNNKDFLKTYFNRFIPCYNISEFDKERYEKNKIFWITNKNDNLVLPNTILLTVYIDNFCNIRMKEELEKHNVILSVGSACNSSSSKASDVVYALKLPPELKSGVLRISFLDDIEESNIIYFVDCFIKILKSNTVKKYYD